MPHTGFIVDPGVIVAQQVQDPVHDQQLYLGFDGMPGLRGLQGRTRHGDEDIAQVTGAGLRVDLLRWK